MKQAKKPRTKKTPKGEQTRTVIENAALELIRERGYEKTTMRAIAEKAAKASSMKGNPVQLTSQELEDILARAL